MHKLTKLEHTCTQIQISHHRFSPQTAIPRKECPILWWTSTEGDKSVKMESRQSGNVESLLRDRNSRCWHVTSWVHVRPPRFLWSPLDPGQMDDSRHCYQSAQKIGFCLVIRSLSLCVTSVSSWQSTLYFSMESLILIAMHDDSVSILGNLDQNIYTLANSSTGSHVFAFFANWGHFY